jgi:hypothetical protein
VALCQAIIDSHHRSAPVDYPSEVGAGSGLEVAAGSGKTIGTVGSGG